MKKLCAILLCTLLLLASCAPKMNEDEVVQKKDETTNKEPSIVPSYQLSEETYKMVLPYKVSKARGVIVKQMGNRLDIDEMEEGLRRHSKAVYDPEKYYFQEGQYLDEDTVYSWLERKYTKEQLAEKVEAKVNDLKARGRNIDKKAIEKELQQGLNPKLADEDEYDEKANKANPTYLSHILEQDFLKKNEDNSAELVGISIGLALKSVYRFQKEEYGPYFHKEISKEEMLKQGKKMAQTILERIRKMDKLKNVPVMIALYREEDQGSPVPGNYVAKTAVSGDESTIDDWESIKEDNVLFPDEDSEEKYFDDNKLVEDFGKEIQKFFPNYVGVIGEGFYINEELKKLTLEIPIEFYGKGEVIGFTQYTYGLIKEMFPDYYDLEVKVMTNNNVESIIHRNAGESDPTVRIFN
ncbi:CamS family sex pheromone protein [Virgibacillus sp. FSP13]